MPEATRLAEMVLLYLSLLAFWVQFLSGALCGLGFQSHLISQLCLTPSKLTFPSSSIKELLAALYKVVHVFTFKRP